MRSSKTTNLLSVVLPLFCCGLTLADTKQATDKIKIIPAFDKSQTRPLKAKAPDWINAESLRVSPDGKYVARLTLGEGEAGRLTVYLRSKNGGALLKRHAVSREVDGAQGCAWVPGHPHWLLISNYGDGDDSFIWLWTGSKNPRALRHSTRPGAGYNVRGVAANGRFAIYEHYGPGSPDPTYQRKGHLILKLPRS